MIQTFSFKGHTFRKRELYSNETTCFLEIIDPHFDVIVFKEQFDINDKNIIIKELRYTLIEWMKELYIPTRHDTMTA